MNQLGKPITNVSDELNVEFKSAFEALTDYRPLRWQTRLYNRMVSSEIPKGCDLPTGMGKTSIIPIWLIALCKQAIGGRTILPRRLVYIVNRRTVVDQATTIVERIRKRLLNPNCPDWSKHSGTLEALVGTLQSLSPKELDALAVSTLRGELADNEEWKTDPARAAIIVGTIDMIGSKLLFSGYGDGRYKRSHHAGLVGQDTLIVHDEAHLTPAFSELLRSVSDIQAKEREPRPVRVMELSATRHKGVAEDEILRLEADDEKDNVIRERFDARKLIRLRPSDKKGLNKRIADLAYEDDGSRAKVLVYVRSPEDADKIASDLDKRIKDKSDERVALLTGTIRGHERDRLVTESPVYRQFLNHEARPPKTVYLVSTSAGEVGIDIDADRMVCDLAPLDSMIQRLGRVNRLGGDGRQARIDVVWTEEQVSPGNQATGFDMAAAKTLELLRSWEEEFGGSLDASPRNVQSLIDGLSREDRAAVFSPEPRIRKVTDVLLDGWTLTSVDDMPGRPEVAPYLHGDANDRPETHIAWRREISEFRDDGLNDDGLTEWFRLCPIRSNERITNRTDWVKRSLNRLMRAHRKLEDFADFSVALIDSRGNAKRMRLSEVLSSNDRQALVYKTLVLPVEIGGLAENGALDSNLKNGKPIEDIDVADQVDGERMRMRIFPGDSRPDGWVERGSVVLSESDEALEDGEPKALSLMMPGRGRSC